MRFSLVVALTALCAAAFATPVQHDEEFLTRQRQIFRLFRYINQPSYNKKLVDAASKFNFNAEADYYNKTDVAKNFTRFYENGLLPRGEIFSVFYERHLQEAVALFKLFFYARDYETFYNTAVWARQNVNEGLFLYAVSVAIVHRPDTNKFVIPPIYEVYPNYFFNSEVIQKAYRYKQQNFNQEKDQESGYNGYTINANYSGYYLNLHPEQSLSYFTEDVGINSYYYYFNIFFPFWLGGEDFDFQYARRGELFYYMYQQLLARYYAERLSNGFGEIPFFNYEAPLETGFYPSLRYPNGLEFPSRPNFANLYEYFYNYGQRYGNNKYAYSYTLVQDYERRIRDAIDRGFIYTSGEKVYLNTPKAINVLGNLIDSNADSYDQNYYGALQVYARHLLGYSYQPLNRFNVAPSALEHFETSARDPAFYQLYKRILLFFQKYQLRIPSYTREDLLFQGVEVTDVKFDRLVTYFDYFYSDLSNGVFVNSEEFEGDRVQIRARQYRLNHKAFTYEINVKSEKKQDAIVKIFYGPKYDEYNRYINVSQNRLNFVQFDYFRYELQAGENNIKRNSRQTFFYQNDRTSYRELYEQVLGALNRTSDFTASPLELFGFPRRFLIPKGTYEGLEYQFYVVVYPAVALSEKPPTKNNYYPFVASDSAFSDSYSFGYPFDRPIYYEQYFNSVPNFYVYDAKVYHRDVSDINASTA